MTAVEEIKNKLLKLNKTDLVRILINKKVPDDLKFSQEAVDFLESNHSSSNTGPQNDFDSANGDAESVFETQKKSIMQLSMKYDLIVAKVELEASKRLICELERTIDNQKLIISLLQSNYDAKVVGYKENNSDITKQTLNQPPKEFKKVESAITVDSLKVAIDDEMTTLATTKENDKSGIPSGKSTIVGNKMAQESLAAPPVNWLFVRKYRTTYTVENLTQYLKAEFPDNNFIVEQITNRGSHNSFKVGVEESIYDKVTQPDIWPHGIEVSPFQFFRKQPTGHSNWKYQRNRVNRIDNRLKDRNPSHYQPKRPQFTQQARTH